jgi:hypothetical protein
VCESIKKFSKDNMRIAAELIDPRAQWSLDERMRPLEVKTPPVTDDYGVSFKLADQEVV